MNNRTIKVENVSKAFSPSRSIADGLRFNKKKAVQALEGISFSVKQGEILGILGPNGAGKTTLLKILSTLILPDQGTVLIQNNRCGQNDEKIKSLIGLVTCEERSFYWRLTGRQNLEFFAPLYGLSRQETKSRVEEFFKLFEIDYADKRFDSYSTGMKRKFSLIRALLHHPKVLILDEPTKSLDYHAAQELRDFIKCKTKENVTTLFATHQMQEAEALCDRFLILHQGKLRGLGTLEELRKQLSSPQAPLSEIYLKLTKNA